jgi:hypothetical protein
MHFPGDDLHDEDKYYTLPKQTFSGVPYSHIAVASARDEEIGRAIVV